MKKGPFILSLLGGLFLAGLSVYGFTLLRHRPDLPREITRASVVRVDAGTIRKADELDLVLSQKAIGDWVTVSFRSQSGPESRSVQLVPYYSQVPFPIIYLVIGLINLMIGLAVFILKPDDVLARIFYWAMISFSYAVIINGDFYGVGRSWPTWIPGFLYNILYALAPALLVHFSLALSRRRPKILHFALIYGPALLLTLVIDALYLVSIIRGSLGVYRWELRFVYIFRWYVLAATAVALVYLLLRFLKTERLDEKGQIQWLLYGLIIGLTPFILLYQLPRILGKTPLVSEELSSVFYIVIPLAFAMAIIKFKLMHIELVINRSLVYAILTIMAISLYLLSLELFRLVFARFFKTHETVLSLSATIIVAAVFNPGRKKIQGFVDKAFFRQSYDARRAVLHFSEGAQRLAGEEELADFFQAQLAGVLPLEHLDLAVQASGEAGTEIRLARGDGSALEGLGPAVRTGRKPLARKQAVRFRDGLDFSQEELLGRYRLDLALPMSFNSPSLAGFAAFGPKRSGQRFSAEDLELLSALLAELTLHLERVKLQKDVISERASKEKFDELNRLKTEFISSVSHELRTPLSSLQGLVEILQSGKLKDESRREKVLEIMACESTRLSRLLHNILDFGKMEQQVKVYDLRPTDLRPLVDEVVKLFRFSGEARGVELRADLPGEAIILNLDRDAIKQALINLVDNAIKYSTDKREVEIRIIDHQGEVQVRVRDWGIGIPPQDRERIFDKFYRADSASRLNPQGVGLGLKIVKHIIEAHGGAVRVEPAPGQGIVFSLVFPRT